MGRVFTPHDIDLIGGGVRLDARMHSARMRATSVSLLSYGADVRIDCEPTETFFAVLVPLSGLAEIRCGPDRVALTTDMACVVSPTDQVHMRWPSDCVQLIVRLERAPMEACLAELLGAPLRRPLRFAPAMDIRSGYGRSWCHALDLLVSELDRPGSLIEQSAVADRFENTLMSALLVGHEHNYTRMLKGEVSAAPTRAVSIALEWIEGHPKRLHTTASLAREADVTARSLQLGFRKHFNMGPMEYLREVRLRRVRDQLVAAQSDAVTVTEIAAEWGFLHGGHFAARYQRRFGERPSETLRRSGGG
ncbi:AraC family transcriptional regulator [Amycolatopsis sp. NPDC049868]|uniref:AraC family transcriptional regulator n=1 Tax=Amycolatopsis sp. NPDC049868 TaxID=3363934 RepID=UPI00379E13C2